MRPPWYKSVHTPIKWGGPGSNPGGVTRYKPMTTSNLILMATAALAQLTVFVSLILQAAQNRRKIQQLRQEIDNQKELLALLTHSYNRLVIRLENLRAKIKPS
jgi:hypothetical protein